METSFTSKTMGDLLHVQVPVIKDFTQIASIPFNYLSNIIVRGANGVGIGELVGVGIGEPVGLCEELFQFGLLTGQESGS